MSRVITFSRTFPAYHPKSGQKTYFIQKIWRALVELSPDQKLPFSYQDIDEEVAFPKGYDPKHNIFEHEPKWHTIRSGNRWKAGDKFSPRVWSGKPYASKQLVFAPDIEIKQVMRFEIQNNNLFVDGEELIASQWIELAGNDGLSISDMLAWFRYPKPFNGQIICWHPGLHY